ncbi:MAG: response regulator [Anaerolineae bacterium]|nr:response regulator [Anaerolineae bacterium]
MPDVMLTKVLIIDDDAVLTSILKDTLTRETFEVFVANSGSEGIRAIEQLMPDVVVLDLMMPGLSGWEVCRRIRAFSQVPILVLSAVVDPAMVMQALDEGADDYILKPVTTNVLASRLRRLTKQARIARNDESGEG